MMTSDRMQTFSRWMRMVQDADAVLEDGTSQTRAALQAQRDSLKRAELRNREASLLDKRDKVQQDLLRVKSDIAQVGRSDEGDA